MVVFLFTLLFRNFYTAFDPAWGRRNPILMNRSFTRIHIVRTCNSWNDGSATAYLTVLSFVNGPFFQLKYITGVTFRVSKNYFAPMILDSPTDSNNFFKHNIIDFPKPKLILEKIFKPNHNSYFSICGIRTILLRTKH